MLPMNESIFQPEKVMIIIFVEFAVQLKLRLVYLGLLFFFQIYKPDLTQTPPSCFD